MSTTKPTNLIKDLPNRKITVTREFDAPPSDEIFPFIKGWNISFLYPVILLISKKLVLVYPW